MRGSHQQTQTEPLPDYKGQGQQEFFPSNFLMNSTKAIIIRFNTDV